MKLSDQPGRIFAILILSPYLVYCGYNYSNKLLIIIGIIFFFYELFWVMFYDPKYININTNNILSNNLEV